MSDNGIIIKKIFCVSCILILVLSLVACSSGFDGSRVKNDDEYKLDFSVLNISDAHDLITEMGDTIKANIMIEEGSISIKIQKDDEEPVYEGNGDAIPEEFSVEIQESGSYTVTVTGKGAKGSVDFMVEKRK